MFENNDKGMKAALSQIQAEALRGHCGNRVEARTAVLERLAYDRRFDKYDHAKLIERVEDAWGQGAQLDLDDPKLLRERPANRYGQGRIAR
jgi:hypothetical protein